MFGIAGMVIAIVTTLADPGVVSFSMILLGMVIGGSIGTLVALRIQMTALPQLVAPRGCLRCSCWRASSAFTWSGASPRRCTRR